MIGWVNVGLRGGTGQGADRRSSAAVGERRLHHDDTAKGYEDEDRNCNDAPLQSQEDLDWNQKRKVIS